MAVSIKNNLILCWFLHFVNTIRENTGKYCPNPFTETLKQKVRNSWCN